MIAIEGGWRNAPRFKAVGSRQKRRFLPAANGVMSAEIAAGDFGQ
jgi:hypothetical protein